MLVLSMYVHEVILVLASITLQNYDKNITSIYSLARLHIVWARYIAPIVTVDEYKSTIHRAHIENATRRVGERNICDRTR
ncbi:MAG: hypothetical protein NVS4B1_36180 [Ktedonobacteraceae bacterium]